MYNILPILQSSDADHGKPPGRTFSVTKHKVFPVCMRNRYTYTYVYSQVSVAASLALLPMRPIVSAYLLQQTRLSREIQDQKRPSSEANQNYN